MKLRWEKSGTFTPDPDVTVAVQAADSWLVQDGHTRGLERHRARFVGTCAQHYGRDATDFFDAAVAQIPTSGRWFPRVELHDGHFRIAVRPAPPASTSVALRLPAVADPRRRPSIKGPDLQTLIALRAQAGDGHEAVLVSPEGWVREGALSSLMWWREDVLCAPPEGPDLLPSVTRELVLAQAAERGRPVVFEAVRDQDLAELECWSLSALHGIRTNRNQARRDEWQQRLG